MKRLIPLCILVTLFSASNVYSAEGVNRVTTTNTYKKTDIQSIDSQIESLENLKGYYLSKAIRLRNRGDRLNFDSKEDNRELAQKYWHYADRYDRLSDQIQEEINSLEEERKDVLNKRDY